jgi:hypothetical protein
VRLELGYLALNIRARSGNRTDRNARFRRQPMRGETLLPKTVFAIVLLGMACVSRAQKTPSQPVNSEQGATSVLATPLEDRERELGPFAMAGQSFTLLVREKSFPGAADQSGSRTLAALELRDAKGAALYQRAFPVEVEEGKFKRTMSASAQLLAGKNLAGLLITYEWERNGEVYGDAWQLFGFRDGKLGLYGTKWRLHFVPDGARGGSG